MEENPTGLKSFNSFNGQLAIDSPEKARNVRDFYERGTLLGAYKGFIMFPISKVR